VAEYLASDLVGFVSGQHLLVSGGGSWKAGVRFWKAVDQHQTAGTRCPNVKRWLAKFEHWAKWNFCLNSARMPRNRRYDDEAYPP